MWRRRLFWKLTLTFSLILVFCMASVGGYLVYHQHRTTRRQVEDQLARIAKLVDERFAPLFDFDKAAVADSLAVELGSHSDTRITIIAADGRVLADTEGDPDRMENHKFRPEVQEAIGGRLGSSMRFSATLRQPFLYVALPSEQRPGWIVRVAVPLTQFQRNVRAATNVVLLGTAIATVFAILLAALLTHRITLPLNAMRSSLQRLERGEFGVRLDPGGADELGVLARTLNRAQDQLERTIQNLTGQRNQRDAILASMVEGLVAVDSEERILLMNRSARRLLALETQPVEGRALVEVVRQPDLVRFIRETRGASGPRSGEIGLHDRGTQWLELQGAPLRLGVSDMQGAVVVFNDVTRLKKLEKVRRDFVGNVSHELRTPITSIRGFLETLLHRDALEDSETARRFLGIVLKHTDRLSAIIDDLLYLSRLEHEGQGIVKHPIRVTNVVEACIADFKDAAAARGIDLVFHAETHARVLGDSSLLRRALDNLVDNAIKYSPEGGRVEVRTLDDGPFVLLRVSDQGIGIPEEHLPRISERFYRVDTGRSREMGGTGLGLAIVKHVALVHDGALEIESVLGAGTVVTLRLTAVRSGAPEGTRAAAPGA